MSAIEVPAFGLEQHDFTASAARHLFLDKPAIYK